MVIRHLIRRFFRDLRFSLLILSTVAVTIGLNIGILAVAEEIFLRKLPVPEPDRLVSYSLGTGDSPIPLSGPAVEALHRYKQFGDLAIWDSGITLVQQTDEGAQLLSGALVNGGEFFRVMGIRPTVGRFFDEGADSTAGGRDGWQAVISFDYWKAHYRCAPDAVGTTIKLNGTLIRIVGVLPRDFLGLDLLSPVDVLLPRHFLSVLSPTEDRFRSPGDMEWRVFSRLSAHGTIADVNEQLHIVDSQIRKAADPRGDIFTPDNFPSLAGGSLVDAEPGQFGIVGNHNAVRKPLAVLQGLAGAMLLLGICNAALLMLGRNARQASALAVRVALGATIKNIRGMQLMDGTTLYGMGAFLAIPVAFGTARLLSSLVQSTRGLRGFQTVAPDWHLLSAAVMATLGIGLVVTIISQPKRVFRQPLPFLTGGNRMTESHSGSWIVGVEVFLASLLAITAIIGIGIFDRLVHEYSGFGNDNAVLANVDTSTTSLTDGETNRLLDRMIAEISHRPGVQAVATVNVLPLSGESAVGTFLIRTPNGIRSQDGMWPAEVSLNFFRAIGTRVVLGRLFVSGDLDDGRSVCLLSMSAAKALSGAESPLGQLIYSSQAGAASGNAPYCRVIGIAEDVHLSSVASVPEKAIYRLTSTPNTNIVISAVTVHAAIEAMRGALQAVAPMWVMSNVGSVRTRLNENLHIPGLLTIFASLCAGATLVVLFAGLFGVLMLEVTRRHFDIGIRLTFGANRSDIVKSLCGHFSKAIIIGFISGSVLSVLLIHRMYAVYAMNIVSTVLCYVLGCMMVASIIAIGISYPVRQAWSISPSECLRKE